MYPKLRDTSIKCLYNICYSNLLFWYKHKMSLQYDLIESLIFAVDLYTTILIIQLNLWIADTYGSLKICPLLRGARYWEVILKRLSYLDLKFCLFFMTCPLLGGFTVFSCFLLLFVKKMRLADKPKQPLLNHMYREEVVVPLKLTQMVVRKGQM